MSTDTELVQKVPTKVWVLVIDHKHGTVVTAHSSRAALDDELHDYCAEFWEREFGPEERPADSELVERYWERMSERGEEWHVVEECEVDIAPEPSLKTLASALRKFVPDFAEQLAKRWNDAVKEQDARLEEFLQVLRQA